jgi:hypothetical protein
VHLNKRHQSPIGFFFNTTADVALNQIRASQF